MRYDINKCVLAETRDITVIYPASDKPTYCWDVTPLAPPSPQPEGTVTLWEQIRDNLDLKDSFSLMLCPPRDNLEVGTVLDEQKSYMVSVAGAGVGVRVGWGMGLHLHVTEHLIYVHT